MTNKTIIIVWDTDNYSSRQAAEADGATYEHEIPSWVSPQNEQDYISAFSQGLAAGGERLRADKLALQYEVVELKPFVATGRVLEWNDYTVTVMAESAEDALQKVKDNSIVSYRADDVSYGMEGAPAGIVSEKDLHIVV